jgi:Protein of unknown function (DUF2281)
MASDTVLRDFDSLPPEAQQQVIDFISFLQTRYQSKKISRTAKQKRNLSEEAFIGIWRDRVEMEDSRAWVRELREREWGNKHGGSDYR